MKLRIDKVLVRTDPVLVAFIVEVSADDDKAVGIWPETFGSEHDLRLFLKGIEVAHQMLTGQPLPEPIIHGS